MPEENDIIIRKFESKDRQDVRDIVHDAAFMGESAAVFFEGREVVSDALTLYFTDYEGQSTFVAESLGRVVGCLTGTVNKINSDKVTANKIAPFLLRDAVFGGLFFKKKNINFLIRLLGGIAKGEFQMPEFSEEYPATLHINIRKEFRGRDIGSRLMNAYLDYLRKEKVPGVHLATMSEGAAKFFQKQGFKLLYSGKRSYFRHILHKDITLYIYAMEL